MLVTKLVIFGFSHFLIIQFLGVFLSHNAFIMAVMGNNTKKSFKNLLAVFIVFGGNIRENNIMIITNVKMIIKIITGVGIELMYFYYLC